MASGTQPARVLVFRGGALGDLLLTLPALDALRRGFPGAYIDLVGYERSAVIALVSGLADRLQSLDSARMALYFQDREPLPPEEREYIRSFDLVISFMHDPGGVLLKNLEQAGASGIVAVSPLVSGGHAIDHFLGAIEPIIGRGIESPKEIHGRFRLSWPDKLKAKARRRTEKYLEGKKMIVIHPGSGSPAKNWPADKFIELVKKINSGTVYKAVIMGGEADDKAIALMRKLMPEGNFIVNVPLADAASVIAAAAGYVGNDSGITHLAAILGVPAVALFGPTDPAIWAPRGGNVAVIAGQGGRLDAIEVEEVHARIIALTEKRE